MGAPGWPTLGLGVSPKQTPWAIPSRARVQPNPVCSAAWRAATRPVTKHSVMLLPDR